MKTTTAGTGIQRKPLPLTVIYDDLSNALIPDETFRAMVRASTGAKTAADLPPHSVDESVWRAYSRITANMFTPSAESRTLGCRRSGDAVKLAIETVLCGVGSCMFINPGMVALTARRGGNIGNGSFAKTLSETDIVFLSNVLDPVNIRVMQQDAEAASDFLSVMSMLRHGARRVLVLDLFSPTVGQKHLETIYEGYGRATGDLLLADIVMV